jgi:peptidoglycan/xylan/chitin deacetylase (PgdA/CDA1 family)
MLINKIYYIIKPAIPRRFQIFIRRRIALYKRKKFSHIWPIDPGATVPPSSWTGWPHNKKFAFILTHDVDTQKGHDRVLVLAKIEENHGFRSSFNFVPERYKVSAELRQELVNRGFEVGVHGLNHDGKLYSSKETFTKRAVKINQYIGDWNCVGFRSPAMHHNLEWIHYLNIEYDASTFDTDPFEPQSDAVGTIFPFWVKKDSIDDGYVEFPYTLPQDFTLFVLLKEKSTDIWKNKLSWIADNGGMALLNVHPDYLALNENTLNIEEYRSEYYSNFLRYVKDKYSDQFWHVLPKEAAAFFKRFIINKGD